MNGDLYARFLLKLALTDAPVRPATMDSAKSISSDFKHRLETRTMLTCTLSLYNYSSALFIDHNAKATFVDPSRTAPMMPVK